MIYRLILYIEMISIFPTVTTPFKMTALEFINFTEFAEYTTKPLLNFDEINH